MANYLKELNANQIAFCEEYVANGFKARDAYKLVYQTDNNDMASSAAYKMLKDPRCIDKINEIEGNYRELGRKVGIDKTTILSKIKLMLDAKKPFYYNGKKVEDIDDYGAINAAITTYAKLTGEFAPEKKNVIIEDISTINPNELTPEEVEAKKKEILNEL